MLPQRLALERSGDLASALLKNRRTQDDEKPQGRNER
jgi:hypothetical protein